MKNFLLFLVLAISLLSLSSCKKDSDNDAQKYYLHIDVQSNFENDNVSIRLNNIVLIQGKFKTNDVLGIAGGKIIPLKPGDYELNVNVNNSINYTEIIHFTKTEYLGINYIKQNGSIKVNHSPIPFIYE